MKNAKTANGNAARRALTEDSLLDAFEVVLVRDGIRRLSVNSLVGEAGVGKPLLYRYFSDLPGLIRAWAERRGFWPRAPMDRAARRNDISDDAEFRRSISNELVGNAEYLRSHPVTLELLAEELTADSDISDAFARARNEHGRPFLKTMLTDQRYVRPENRRLIIVLNAALIYLAMRSRRSPNFMGLRLDSEDGWNEAMTMVRDIIECSR